MTLCYINIGQVLLVKGGEQAIYLQYVVCGQIRPVANLDPSVNLDTHKFEENEVLIYVPFIISQLVYMEVCKKC